MMLGEALAAMLVGTVVLWLVLQPLLRPTAPPPPAYEPPDPEETPKGIALAALKEIEFDRATGKLSEEDYEFLRARYSQQALAALAAATAVSRVAVSASSAARACCEYLARRNS